MTSVKHSKKQANRLRASESAMDQQKSLLDELMGKNRNLSVQELKQKNEQYYDPDVCKNYLVCFCFNELFPNTSHDEGPCKKRHDPLFKHQFENDDTVARLHHEKRFIADAIHYIESKIVEVDVKIKQKKQQLEGPAAPVNEVELSKEVQERVEQIEFEIKRLLQQSTLMGEQGQLEEAEALAEEADKLRMQKEEAIRHTDNPINARDQKVCDICGAYQAANDTQQRMATHLDGKIHQGFLLLRKELDKLKRRREDIKTLLEQKRKEEESSQSHSKSRSRDRKKKKEKKKYRKRSSESSSRSRSRDKKHRKKHHKKHRADSD